MKIETTSPRQMTEIWNEENQPISPYMLIMEKLKFLK